MRPIAPAVSAACLAVVAALAPGRARAQMVALPVIQAPFPGRSFAGAVDAGGGGDGLRTLGLALAFRRGGSRLTGTVGAGAVQGFATTRPSFGLRVAYLQPIGAGGSLGAAPFVGFGAVPRGDVTRQLRSTNGRPLLPGSLAVIPAGVGLGYRRAVGGRTVALHVTPQAQLWRLGPADSAGAESRTRTFGRVGVGLDVALTRQLGLTLAGEGGAASAVQGTGQTATGLAEGPRRILGGIALSYTPQRGRR